MPPTFKPLTKDAISVLESAEILPKDAHPHPTLEVAAIAMYRDPWWRSLPLTNPERGSVYRSCDLSLKGCHHPVNTDAWAGEIPWR